MSIKKAKLWVVGVLLLATWNVLADEVKDSDELTKIEVYRSPSCSCCSRWVGHLEKNGFLVTDFVTDDMDEVKRKYGVSKNVASCHTALVGGYVVEGHVPALDIRKLLKHTPVATGISVPGMPVGTPGMEMGGKRDSYDVVQFSKEKEVQVFSRYDYSK